jgi:hypothetical protein
MNDETDRLDTDGLAPWEEEATDEIDGLGGSPPEDPDSDDESEEDSLEAREAVVWAEPSWGAAPADPEWLGAVRGALSVRYEHDGPARRSNPEHEQLIGDLVAAGHGFLIETAGSVKAPPPPCPLCGGPMYTNPTWICECTMEDVLASDDDKIQPRDRCHCNWCVINREALPGRGQPRQVCGRPECRKADKSARNKRDYRRRQRRKQAKRVSASIP